MVRGQFYIIGTIFAAMFLLSVFFTQLAVYEYDGDASNLDSVFRNIRSECLRAVEISHAQSESKAGYDDILDSNLADLENYFNQKMDERNYLFEMQYSVHQGRIDFSLSLDDGKTKITDGFSVDRPEAHIYP